MKKFFYIFTVILLLLFIFFDSGFAQETVGPKMVIEQTDYDAKEVKQGDIINHAFKVMNKGDQPLEIKSVKPG